MLVYLSTVVRQTFEAIEKGMKSASESSDRRMAFRSVESGILPEVCPQSRLSLMHLIPRPISSSDHTTSVPPHELHGPCRIPGILKSKLVPCNMLVTREIACSQCRAPSGGVEANERVAEEHSRSCRVERPPLDLWYGEWPLPDDF